MRQLAAFADNSRLVAELDSSLLTVRRQEERLRFQAPHDPLTQLANRSLFDEKIYACAVGGPVVRAAILVIDLDDFKMINDTCGHHAGDAVLVAAAKRLGLCSRGGDTVARLGGDEFAVLLPGATVTDGNRVAARILDAFAEPVLVDGRELRIRASLGVAAGPANDPEALMRAADAAMYTAKQRGKDAIVAASR